MCPPCRATLPLLAMLVCLLTMPARSDAPAATHSSLHVVRRYALPVTEYRWRLCWRGRLNPFAPPYPVWELVPCTRWEWRCEVVAVPPPPGVLRTLEPAYGVVQPPRPTMAQGVQRLAEGPPRVGPRLVERAADPASPVRRGAPGGPNGGTAARPAAPTAGDSGMNQGWRPARPGLR